MEMFTSGKEFSDVENDRDSLRGNLDGALPDGDPSSGMEKLDGDLPGEGAETEGDLFDPGARGELPSERLGEQEVVLTIEVEEASPIESLEAVKKDLIEGYRSDLEKMAPDFRGDLKMEEVKSVSAEECAQKRAEFSQDKNSLIREWEAINGKEWPRYQEDVFDSVTGTKVRRAGDRYDAHHPQPLKLNGENAAGNITPMHYNDHSDHRGIHAPGGNLAKLVDVCNKEELLKWT